MSTGNLKLEKSLSGFRSTGPWNINTIPSEEPCAKTFYRFHHYSSTVNKNWGRLYEGWIALSTG
jgi:hypothetical protein